MANTLLTASAIANEALLQFKNGMSFTKGANRQYDDSFSQKGAKIGNTINVRKPQRFTVSDGATLVVQDVKNETIPLILNQRKHVAFSFGTDELSLSIDKFSESYVTPAALALANKVDMTGLMQARTIANSVGTPGTTPTSTDIAGDAGQKLAEFGAPEGNRTMLLNPKAMNKIVAGSKGLFQGANQLNKQYETGLMATASGFDWRQSQNIYMHTTGPQGGTPLVNGAGQTGSTLLSDGFAAAAALRLKQGDVFAISGVFAVNPLTFQNTGELQQFVVTGDVTSDGAGNASIPIFPPITTTGTTQTVTASPADNAAIVLVGGANVVTPQNLAYHKDAFILGCADLEMPKNVDMSAMARDPESGLSIRFVRFYDGNADKLISRLDILFGWLTAHPEWAVRVQG